MRITCIGVHPCGLCSQAFWKQCIAARSVCVSRLLRMNWFLNTLARMLKLVLLARGLFWSFRFRFCLSLTCSTENFQY